MRAQIYSLKIQCPNGDRHMETVGKQKVDLARFADEHHGITQAAAVEIPLKAFKTSAILSIRVTACPAEEVRQGAFAGGEELFGMEQTSSAGCLIEDLCGVFMHVHP